jgi:hypothetical protein
MNWFNLPQGNQSSSLFQALLYRTLVSKEKSLNLKSYVKKEVTV